MGLQMYVGRILNYSSSNNVTCTARVLNYFLHRRKHTPTLISSDTFRSMDAVVDPCAINVYLNSNSKEFLNFDPRPGGVVIKR